MLFRSCRSISFTFNCYFEEISNWKSRISNWYLIFSKICFKFTMEFASYKQVPRNLADELIKSFNEKKKEA